MFQGSNPYYIKLQVRNHNIPVKVVNLLNNGVYKPLQRTTDNFFVNNNQAPLVYPLVFPIQFQVQSIDGQIYNDTISSLQNGVVIQGNFQFKNINGSSNNNNSGHSSFISFYFIFFIIFGIFLQ